MAIREVSSGDTVRFELGAERVQHAVLVAAARDTLVVRPIAGAGMLYGFRPHADAESRRKHPIDAIQMLDGLALGATVGVAAAGTSTPAWRPFNAARAAAP